MKAVLSKILALHENGKGTDFNRKECAQDLVADGREEEKLTAWQRVELSRRKDRPVGSDYIDALFTDFVEFHGDRYFADDIITCVKTIQDNFIHQTVGTETADEECDLNYAIGAPIEKKVDYVLTNSLGFGGHNAVLLLKRYEG